MKVPQRVSMAWCVWTVLIALLGLGSGFCNKPQKAVPIHKDTLDAFDVDNKSCVTLSLFLKME